MEKVKKYNKAIKYFFWAVFFVSILIIGSYWVYKIIDIHQTKIEIANNTFSPPFCGNSLVDPLLGIFNWVIPFTFGSLTILLLNSFVNKEVYYLQTFAFILSIIILTGLFRELAEISLLFGDLPLFSCIWWWPFGEI